MFTRPKNADERLALRRAFVPKDARCILEHTNGSAAYVYEVNGKPYAIGFWGTAGRPYFHYSYRTEDQRNQAIWQFKTSVEQSVERRTQHRAEKSAAVNTLKVGDILYTSWGYDQTNVDFYAVTKVSGKRVYVRPIAADYEATGYMSGKTWPAMPIQFTGEESWHVAQCYKGGTSLTINGHHASLETGRDHHTSSYA